MNLLAYLRYGKYILRHKWFVFQECWKAGIPLVGLTHDLSKLRLDELLPYAASFYGPKYPPLLEIHGDARGRALDNGHYKEAVREAFEVAWLKHLHRNPHHWNYYVYHTDRGKTLVLEMPERYRIEMVADWRGAGRAINGKDDTQAWYLERRNGILLAPETRAWVEGVLDIR